MENEKYVIDTSVTVKLFLDEQYKEITDLIFHKSIKGDVLLYAPVLTWYEIVNVLVKEKIPKNEIEKHLLMLKSYANTKILNIVPYSSDITNKALEIATTDTNRQGHVSSYDATFHALALLEHAIYLTADEKHYRKTNVVVYLCYHFHLD